MEINIDKLKSFPAATIILNIFGIIIPGFLLMYIYKKDLFYTLDLFRVSALAISITFPIVFINGFIATIGFFSPDIEKESYYNKAYTAYFFCGGLFSLPVIYAAIIFGYFFDLNIKQGFLTMFIAEFVSCISIYLIFHKK